MSLGAATAKALFPRSESLEELGWRSVLRGPQAPHLIRDELLSEIFAATVAADPDAVALVTRDGKLSYGEVDAKAEAIARGLVRKGLRPGDVAGLWMARGPDLLIGQLAIAKVGAAWLPFDGDAPVERIAVCLDDAEAKAIVTSPDFAEKLGERMPCPSWTFRDLIDPSDAKRVDARALGATPDSPAYLIYTSGSTGTPKGIVISGRNICHYLRAANEVYGLSASDVVFQGAPRSPSTCRWKRSGFLISSERASLWRRPRFWAKRKNCPRLWKRMASRRSTRCRLFWPFCPATSPPCASSFLAERPVLRRSPTAGAGQGAGFSIPMVRPRRRLSRQWPK
ncbi:protein of unknown function [Methylocella tundrae]|uniref:AMP-dependent synthetase/ligase domain-containing protein n=1 Tax=Methylocella tundrae TaxID=227605 RepID=A0A4U8YYX4_METTU|nr:protein of unknown function [Methylocella tundrae]